jgi:hypothetical protein
MTQAYLLELLVPWKQFPRTLLLYASAWLVGAIFLGLLHVNFPPESRTAPPNVNQEFKAAPENGVDKTGPDLISSWESVRKTEDVAALNKFINRFPNSQFTDAAWDRLSQLIQGGALKVAGENAGLDIIATVLQHERDAPPAPLESIVSYYDLAKKYPLGFALFYSDGRRLLYSGNSINSSATFNPASIKVRFLNELELCFTGFVWNGPGSRMIMDNICVGLQPGNKMNFYRGRDVAVTFESLAASPSGAAFIIGLHK